MTVVVREHSQRLKGSNHVGCEITEMGIEANDVPFKMETGEKFLAPSSFHAPQHNTSCLDMTVVEVALWSNTQELAKKCTMPSVVVFYVFVQLPVDSRQSEERRRVKKRGDMSDGFARQNRNKMGKDSMFLILIRGRLR
jgi:hypothetical protein